MVLSVCLSKSILSVSGPSFLEVLLGLCSLSCYPTVIGACGKGHHNMSFISHLVLALPVSKLGAQLAGVSAKLRPKVIP